MKGLAIVGAVLVGLAANGGALRSSSQTPPARVPLVPGLTAAAAFALPTGDGESMARVDAVDARGLHLTLSGEAIATEGPLNPLGDLFGSAPKPKPTGKSQRLRVKRTVLAADLKSSRHMRPIFTNADPESFPGATMFRISDALFRDFKTRGEAELSCDCATGLAAMASTLGSGLEKMLGKMAGDLKDLKDSSRMAGTMKRVGSQAVMVPVLLNDVRAELPALHVKGRLGDEEAEFHILDDPDNPMMLRLHVGAARAHIVRIAFPVATNARPIATALEKAGRVDVYGIYFDFGSAVLKPESEPVLKEIAEALSANASWQLGVEGHTDNIGGNDANLDLSRRRAAAVKSALVQRYAVAEARLTTTGLGASKPKDSNDTLEGRARNRRVELIRR